MFPLLVYTEESRNMQWSQKNYSRDNQYQKRSDHRKTIQETINTKNQYNMLLLQINNFKSIIRNFNHVSKQFIMETL